MAKLEVYEDRAGEWRWRLLGGNGETMAQSEGYRDKTDARRGAEDLRDAVLDTDEELEEE